MSAAPIGAQAAGCADIFVGPEAAPRERRRRDFKIERYMGELAGRALSSAATIQEFGRSLRLFLSTDQVRALTDSVYPLYVEGLLSGLDPNAMRALAFGRTRFILGEVRSAVYEMEPDVGPRSERALEGLAGRIEALLAR